VVILEIKISSKDLINQWSKRSSALNPPLAACIAIALAFTVQPRRTQLDTACRNLVFK
jgi:hypothetical protein